MKTPKSSAEILTEQALNHFDIIISQQKVKVKHAQYLSLVVSKLLYKCEELRISRDRWRERCEVAESKS